MKAIVALVFILATGCDRSSVSSIKIFIPGTYIKPVNSEYSTGQDTLIIKVISDEGNNYLIKRRTGYQRIIAGKLGHRQIKSEDWIGIFNENEKVLHETKYGKVISFDPGNMKLYVGNSGYSKIAQ